MSPPGRRRGFLLALLFLLTTNVTAAVLGIDFGTLNLKATLVKPGIPLEIVLTKDSKRKEAAAVAFKPTLDSKRNVITEPGTFPERAYGPDALALQGRMPGEVFPNLKPLLGLPFTGSEDEVIEQYKARYPAVQIEQVQKLGTVVKSSAFDESERTWSVEELLGMELAGIKRNAEGMAGNVVEDVVITIPPFYTAEEKRAVERAADLAGMNVMGLISNGLAVGLDYAKTRTFPTVNEGGKAEHHLVFDMGAGSTTATLLRFQGRTVKDVGRFNKTIQEVTVLSTGWDRTLGGDSLTHVIVQDYIHKFLTKPVAKSRSIQAEELFKNGRVMSRLWKEAEKSRLTLSANTETTSSFEELLPEIDFRTKLSRAEFEKLTESFAERVTVPIKDALATAKMSIADIDSVILHGGLVRTPFVQRKLENLVGSAQKLKSNVNADESAVFGAALKAAALSPSFKVKEIRDSDIAGYAAGMTHIDNGKERRQVLFTATSPVGSGAITKQISFKNKEDFDITLYQQVGDVDQPISSITTTNLTDSVQALKEKFGCDKGDVSTKFSARLSAIDGLPEIVLGTVSCETDQAVKLGSVGDSVKDWLGFGKKKDQEPLDGEEPGPTESVDASTTTSSGKSSSTSSSSTSTSKVPEKPKKRIETINIAFTVESKTQLQTSPEELQRSKTRLAAFDASDRARIAREGALNALEAYTYSVRDFLEDTVYSAMSTSAQREAIASLLATTRSWMEDSQEVAKATEKVLKEKLLALKKLVEPIKLRKTEGEARPEKVKALKDSLEKTESLMTMVREQVKAVELASSSAAELEASSSSAAAASASASPTSEPDADVDLDDAESTPASSSTSSSASPTTTPAAGPGTYSYTPEDLVSISTVYESISVWLSEQETAQSKLSPQDDPVLTIDELESQAKKLNDVMMALVQKKMRFQPSSSSKSKSTKTKTSKAKTSKSKKGKETGKPKIMTVSGNEEMPTEEEILKMVKEAQGEDADGSHDEL